MSKRKPSVSETPAQQMRRTMIETKRRWIEGLGGWGEFKRLRPLVQITDDFLREKP